MEIHHTLAAMYFAPAALMLLLFANSHYLQGRMAENQNDWTHAREEFRQVEADDPLHSLALWHQMRASIRLHDDASAEQLLGALPKDFPPELMIQTAREARGAPALKI